jgi:ABC-type molybdate transport system substrate-binding protein
VKELTMSANSLRRSLLLALLNALDDAAKAYETKTGDKVVISYPASSALAKQIEGAHHS